MLSVPLNGGHDSQFKKRKEKKKESKYQKVAFFTLTCEELFYWNLEKKCSVESQKKKKNMNKKKRKFCCNMPVPPKEKKEDECI